MAEKLMGLTSVMGFWGCANRRLAKDTDLDTDSRAEEVAGLVMEKKVNIRCRPCGDFLRLNLGTEPDFYPLPNMLEFHRQGGRLYSFLQD